MPESKHRTIGFLSSNRPSPADLHQVGSAEEKEILLPLDNGGCISFSQGIRNILVLGQTGSGKTTSVVTPAIYSMIKAGCGGVIIDPKGTQGETVRAAAAACGRSEDLIEFGTSPTATRTNLLGNLRPHEIANILMSITMEGAYNDHNAHFFQAGAAKAADAAQVLYHLSRVASHSHFSRQFTPSLGLIDAVINNEFLAYGIFYFFKSELERAKRIVPENPCPRFILEAERLELAVNRDNFHILKPAREDSGSSNRNTREEQTTYRMQRIRDKLHLVNITSELMERFSCVDDDAIPLDFGDLVYRQNKIVFVQFAVNSGLAGEMLCKTIKEQYYKAIMKYGSKLEPGRFTFMVIDEFQNVVDVNQDHPLNDMQLFCVSREMRNINLIATQNVASLFAKGRESAISALLGNCTTRIMLQNSDPVTMKWAGDFREDTLDMKTLERGQCLLETVDDNDKVLSVKDGFNKAFASVQGILKTGRELAARPKPLPKPRELPYQRGTSGLPLAIERCLVKIGAICSSKSKDALCRKLRQMRDLSAQGKPYWERDSDAAEKTDSPQCG